MIRVGRSAMDSQSAGVSYSSLHGHCQNVVEPLAESPVVGNICISDGTALAAAAFGRGILIWNIFCVQRGDIRVNPVRRPLRKRVDTLAVEFASVTYLEVLLSPGAAFQFDPEPFVLFVRVFVSPS